LAGLAPAGMAASFAARSKCEILIPSRCFPVDRRERTLTKFFVCRSRAERCLPTCKGKTLSLAQSILHSQRRKPLLLTRKNLGDCNCAVRTLNRSRSLPRARWVARIACAWDHPGCICGFAAVAVMSAAATSRPIVMPGGTLKRPVIRLSRATTLLRDGAGAISMTSKSIWQARRRTTVQSRVSFEIEFDREISTPSDPKYSVRRLTC
jgi:hypothetical protein